MYSASASLPKKLRPCSVFGELLRDEIIGIGPHQPFRQVERLDHEEPVVGPSRPFLGDVIEQIVLRHDVEDRGLRHLLGVIERHPGEHAGTAVMAGGHEAVKAERRHHLDLVLRHGAERVPGMIDAARRLLRIAVAAQVGADDGEVLGEPRRELVPARMGERIAVHQEERRAVAAIDGNDPRAAGLDFALCEILEHEPRRVWTEPRLGGRTPIRQSAVAPLALIGPAHFSISLLTKPRR